jgi:ABC-2 type transport system ATP-binding protein
VGEPGSDEGPQVPGPVQDAATVPDVAPARAAAPVVAAPRLVARATVLEVRGLSKSYGRVSALSSLDLQVEEGEVYGFLGRNGAGKSTTIRILMGITRASGGAIRLFGEEAKGDHLALRQRIGYVAQDQNFYGWMTPRTIGRFVRGFYPTWDDREYERLLRVLDLPDRKIREFSGGMKSKLALALAVAHRPGLLILDEPTAGLDPVARREFLEMVRDQAERNGRTTFFSTHLLDEVERAADRVGIIDGGRTIYEGPLAALSRKVRRLAHAVRPGAPELPLPSALLDDSLGLTVLQDRSRRGRRELVVRAPADAAWAAFARAADDGWLLEDMSLDDIFVDLVARPAAMGSEG